MRTKFIVGGFAAIAVILGEVWLNAAPQVPEPHQSIPPQARRVIPAHPSTASATATTPTVGAPTATPATIVANTPTTVTVAVAIAPTPLSNGVNLLRVGATGTQPTILGVMHDDGKNGDAVAGDGIYTLQVHFNETAPGEISIEVSGAFPGQLRRVVSSITSLDVFSKYSDSASNVTFLYPAIPANVSVAASSSTSSSHIDVFVQKPDTTYSLAFTVTLVPNPSKLSLQQWFSTFIDPQHILDDSTTMTMETIANGSQALILTSAVPSDYADQFGPLATAYVISKDGSRIATVMESQSDPLDLYGYTADQISDLLLSLTDNLDF